MAKPKTREVNAEVLCKLANSTKEWINSSIGQEELKRVSEESQKQTYEFRASRKMDAYKLKRRIVI